MTRREYRKKKAGKEKKWFQKKTALKVFGGFFALMAACTVLSRAAASVLVAQVEVENPTGGTVTSTFEGQGEVVPSDEKQVFLWAEQQVEKSAAPGTAVKKGDCLVQFRMEYLEKSIDKKNSEIDQLKLQLEQQEVAARGSSYVSSADSAARTLDLAKAQLDAASEKADQAQAAFDSYAGESEEGENEEERQALEEALQAAQSERDAAAQAVDEAQNAYEDAAVQDAAQEANNASAMESARLAGEEIQVQIDDAQKELDVLEKYQAAEGRLCAEEDCVVLENSVADGTVTTGAEVIVTGSGEWLLRGSLDEDSRKRIREGGKASVSMDSGERALDVEIRSVDTGEGSGNTGGNNAAESKGSESGNSSTGNSGSSGSGTGGGSAGFAGVWYAPVPEGTEVSYGDTFTWKVQVPSEQNYDCKIPLTALREDSQGNYCLIVSEESSVLGTVQKAERVPVTVLEKNSEEAAVDSVLEKTDQVIVGSEKYVEEGDQIRIKG